MTYGEHCHEGDVYFENYKEDGDEIWTKIVADHFDCNEKNMAKKGIGNIEILRIILDNKDNIKPDDIVIVGVTDGTRVQSFYRENNQVIPKSFNSWTYKDFEFDYKGLDDEFMESMKHYMVNCRLRFTDEHTKFDMELIKDVISLIKPKANLIWTPEMWCKFDHIATHTNNKIYDFHWSFRGHKEMANWVILNKRVSKKLI